MLTFKQYVRPQTLEEAYTLCQKRSNLVLGGMLWLKMQSRSVNTAIDLCDLGLDGITQDENSWHLGAMVSLRTLETHEGLNAQTQGAFREALRHIVGVQFRNCATLGGSLYGRFGFSDVLTLFQVLDAQVVLYHRGAMSVADFAKLPRGTRDILTEVIVPKVPMSVSYLSQRNTATDFPVLACAVSRIGKKITCAIGARPGAARPYGDDDHLLDGGITESTAKAFAHALSRKVPFESNVRAGADYRQRICAVLVRRALLQLEEN